jgi:Glycogen debranching enzyme N terminal
MNAAHGCPRDTLGGVSVFLKLDERTEWLEADALGGFVSGTTSGVRTHRYHALLLTATTQPTARIVLVNGFDAWLGHAHWVIRVIDATICAGCALPRRHLSHCELYGRSVAHLGVRHTRRNAHHPGNLRSTRDWRDDPCLETDARPRPGGVAGQTVPLRTRAAAFSAMSASGVRAAIPTESQFKSIRALAFGAYGTLFDVYSVACTMRRVVSRKWKRAGPALARKTTSEQSVTWPGWPLQGLLAID